MVRTDTLLSRVDLFELSYLSCAASAIQDKVHATMELRHVIPLHDGGGEGARST